MPVEVIGIDHVYLAVRDLARSTRFYDGVMSVLGYEKLEAPLGGDPHVHYYNRQFGFSLRPARAGTAAHDPYAPGLHHFCFRVEPFDDEAERVAKATERREAEAAAAAAAAAANPDGLAPLPAGTMPVVPLVPAVPIANPSSGAPAVPPPSAAQPLGVTGAMAR